MSATRRQLFPQNRKPAMGLLLGVALMTAGCRSPYYADQGALFGGLTGAGVGAAIGSASGNTGTGAVLGSAVGALSGAVVGNELDNIRAENQAMIDQRLAQRASTAITMHDIISMSQSGLSESVIANHVRTRGVAQPPSTTDLIAMKNAGVSDGVIAAVQEMSAVPIPAAAPVAVTPVPVAPVVVQEHYFGPPPFWGPRYVYGGWHHHHRHAHRHRPGVSWGISVAH